MIFAKVTLKVQLAKHETSQLLFLTQLHPTSWTLDDDFELRWLSSSGRVEIAGADGVNIHFIGRRSAVMIGADCRRRRTVSIATRLIGAQNIVDKAAVNAGAASLKIEQAASSGTMKEQRIVAGWALDSKVR